MASRARPQSPHECQLRTFPSAPERRAYFAIIPERLQLLRPMPRRRTGVPAGLQGKFRLTSVPCLTLRATIWLPCVRATREAFAAPAPLLQPSSSDPAPAILRQAILHASFAQSRALRLSPPNELWRAEAVWCCLLDQDPRIHSEISLCVQLHQPRWHPSRRKPLRAAARLAKTRRRLQCPEPLLAARTPPR